MVLITPLLYPFVCENYGIKRHHIVKEQMTTAGKSAPRSHTNTQYHYYNQYWNKLLDVKSCEAVGDHLTYCISHVKGEL